MRTMMTTTREVMAVSSESARPKWRANQRADTIIRA
jgi:hypothetical protein